MTAAPAPAPTERGWGKLLLAIAAFLLLPAFPYLRAILPIERTTLLFVPAVAASALVGWWAGGRMLPALVWVALAVLMAVQPGPTPAPYWNLARGWSLLLAGAFGLVCLFGGRRPLFPRAMVALSVALAMAFIMSSLGPVKGAQAQETVAAELMRRNAESMDLLTQFLESRAKDWQQASEKVPMLAQMPARVEGQLRAEARAGVVVFPALLALQSLAGLALAWGTYHRLSRTRLGAPLGALRDFRFNDQFVWGLIVGLAIVFLPSLAPLRGLGFNLLVFFGALYALRGLGVLAWFLAPGALAITLLIGFVMLGLFWAPVLTDVALLGFVVMAAAAFALGLGDTWANWRERARPTT